MVRGKGYHIPQLYRAYFENYFENALKPKDWARLFEASGLQHVVAQNCRPFPMLALSGRFERAYVALLKSVMPVWVVFDATCVPGVEHALGWMDLVYGVKAHDERSFAKSFSNTSRNLAWQGRAGCQAGRAKHRRGPLCAYVALGLAVCGVEAVCVAPTLPPAPTVGYSLLLKLGLDARAFFSTYPVWARYPPADVYHLTSQNLASLLLFRRPPAARW